MFEREQPPLPDAVLSACNGERQVLTLPANVLLLYLGWRDVREARAPAPYVEDRSIAPAGAEPYAFIAGLWIGIVFFAAGALWLAFH